MAQSQSRQREHPESRFAKSVEVIDLQEQFGTLTQEPASGQHGHRQKVLIREGPLTAALYTFEPGSRLPDHVVDGVVLIHVLDGHVQVSMQEGTCELRAGQLLRLASGVRHDVAAVDASRMLLTIALEGSGSHP